MLFLVLVLIRCQFCAQRLFDDARHVGVEPLAQHGTQQFGDRIFHRSARDVGGRRRRPRRSSCRWGKAGCASRLPRRRRRLDPRGNRLLSSREPRVRCRSRHRRRRAGLSGTRDRPFFRQGRSGDDHLALVGPVRVRRDWRRFMLAIGQAVRGRSRRPSRRRGRCHGTRFRTACEHRAPVPCRDRLRRTGLAGGHRCQRRFTFGGRSSRCRRGRDDLCRCRLLGCLHRLRSRLIATARHYLFAAACRDRRALGRQNELGQGLRGQRLVGAFGDERSEVPRGGPICDPPVGSSGSSGCSCRRVPRRQLEKRLGRSLGPRLGRRSGGRRVACWWGCLRQPRGPVGIAARTGCRRRRRCDAWRGTGAGKVIQDIVDRGRRGSRTA